MEKKSFIQIVRFVLIQVDSFLLFNFFEIKKFKYLNGRQSQAAL